MTAEQLQLLTNKLGDILAQLHNFTIPLPTSDNFTSNQIIAQARLDLHSIDSQLFNCYKILHLSQSPPPPPRSSTPTIDDLEI